jgi:hypothetical protein
VIEQVGGGIGRPPRSRDRRGSLDLRRDRGVGDVRRQREVPATLLRLVDGRGDRSVDPVTVRAGRVSVDRRPEERMGEPDLTGPFSAVD